MDEEEEGEELGLEGEGEGAEERERALGDYPGYLGRWSRATTDGPWKNEKGHQRCLKVVGRDLGALREMHSPLC